MAEIIRTKIKNNRGERQHNWEEEDISKNKFGMNGYQIHTIINILPVLKDKMRKWTRHNKYINRLSSKTICC